MDGERYDTIFVQIPAYRDPELVPTLVDLIEKAQAPRRLRVGVCWQHDEGGGRSCSPTPASRWTPACWVDACIIASPCAGHQ